MNAAYISSRERALEKLLTIVEVFKDTEDPSEKAEYCKWAGKLNAELEGEAMKRGGREAAEGAAIQGEISPPHGRKSTQHQPHTQTMNIDADTDTTAAKPEGDTQENSREAASTSGEKGRGEQSRSDGTA
jgi:hypothetical protein